MKGYVIFQENISDQAAFDHYKTMSPQSIEKYGGIFIVRGGEIAKLEGNFEFQRVVVIEFPSVKQARAWYNSDLYSDAKDVRLKASQGDAIIVSGI